MYERNENGDVINPPTDRDFEQRINAAANSGSNEAVVAVQSEYDQWRRDKIERDEQQERSDDTPAETDTVIVPDDTADATTTGQTSPAPDATAQTGQTGTQTGEGVPQ